MWFKRFLTIVSFLVAIALTMCVLAHIVVEADAAEVTEETRIVETEPNVDETDGVKIEVDAKDYYILEYQDAQYKIPYLTSNREPCITESGYVEKFTEVPHYFQSFYPNLMYGNTSVRSGGCGIACLSMVLTYLTDKEVTIEELVEKYSKYKVEGGSDYGLFNNTDSDYGVTATQVWNWKDAKEALENGHVIIATPNAKTYFTDGGHFIVLFGITEEGRILVRDPDLYNYNNKWNFLEREDGYANGFNEKSIKYNCFPMWVYSLKDMDAIAARAEAEESEITATQMQ